MAENALAPEQKLPTAIVVILANAVQLSQSAVSHQLRVLKDSKLVRFRRDGKTVYYALDDDHVRSILSMGMDHIEE